MHYFIIMQLMNIIVMWSRDRGLGLQTVSRPENRGLGLGAQVLVLFLVLVLVMGPWSWS